MQLVMLYVAVLCNAIHQATRRDTAAAALQLCLQQHPRSRCTVMVTLVDLAWQCHAVQVVKASGGKTMPACQTEAAQQLRDGLVTQQAAPAQLLASSLCCQRATYRQLLETPPSKRQPSSMQSHKGMA